MSSVRSIRNTTTLGRLLLDTPSPSRAFHSNTQGAGTRLSTIFYSRPKVSNSSFIIRCQPFSTTTMTLKNNENQEDLPRPSVRFAAVDHSTAYEAALAGLHGKQLELAKMEGYGKDDPPFDPFAMEEEIASLLDQAMQEAQAAQQVGDSNSDDRSEEPTKPADQLPEDVVGEEDDEAFEVTDETDDLGDDEDEAYGIPAMYNNDGSLRRKPSQLATLRAGYPGGGLFAVLSMAGSQYKVTTDDVLIVNLLKPVTEFKVGSIHTFKDDGVLLLGSSHYTLVGMPHVKGAEVDVLVEEITKDAKVIVFKKRRRKNSKRKRGFRRDVTMLRILDIRPPEAYSTHYYVPRIEADFDKDDDNVAAA